MSRRYLFRRLYADYLLDTNAFNRSLDLNIDPSTITRRGAVFVTHIQVTDSVLPDAQIDSSLF